MNDREMVAMTNFLHEVGQLRHTARTGYPFLGSGQESVAEHSHRTAVIGYALARRAGLNAERTALLCLFHDLGEARTGDLNYVGKQYVQRDERRALVDATAGTGLESDVLGFWDELENEQSPEAKLAHDADQLDLLLNLKRELDLGNVYAQNWIDNLIPRLETELGHAMAAVIVRVDHSDWWFANKDPSCWARKAAPDFVVRDFQPHDLERVMDLWLRANLEAHSFIEASFWNSHVETVKALLPQATLFVYEQEAEVEGFIGIMDGCIAGLFVNPNLQSRGVGKALLDYAKERFNALSLHVYTKNKGALRFYLRENFAFSTQELDKNNGESEWVMHWEK